MNASPIPAVAAHRLSRVIGRGAYGEVWLAENLFGEPRAVKILRLQPGASTLATSRELEGIRHFEPVSRLHPGLVHVLQVGPLEDGSGFYYVMELADPVSKAAEMTGMAAIETGLAADPGTVEGAYEPLTLRRYLEARGRLPARECLLLGLRLSNALGFLHSRGLIHRDVKPSNVVFVRGEPKLADVGLVTVAGEARSEVGTRVYMPSHGSQQPSADAYALGRVLWEAVAGSGGADFEAPSDLAARPDRDDFLELQEVLFRACDIDPARRYPTATEMHRDLSRILSGESLRESRTAERRARKLRRLAGISVAASLILALWIGRETRRNQELSRLESENRTRMVRLHLSSAERAFQDGLWHQGELWLTRALEFTRDPVEVERLRWRLGALTELSPRLVGLGEHGASVNEIAFDPSGERFVTASDDATARVWDARSGHPVSVPLVHEAAVNDAQFSPDGRSVVTVTADGTVSVWAWETAKPRFRRHEHVGQLWRTAFSPDGRCVLSAGRDGVLRVWDAESGIEVCPPCRHSDRIWWAEFSPDGRSIVSGGLDNVAVVWGLSDGQPRFPPISHPDDVRYVTFSPDGSRVLTACADGTARTWDAATGAPAEPTIQHLRLNYAGYSHDGLRIVTTTGNVGESSEARVWDSRTGSPVGVPVRHRSRVRYAQFSPDDRWLATASHDGFVHLAPVGAQDDGVRLWHGARVWSIAFSSDGERLVAAGEDPTWRMWNLKAQRTSTTLLRQQAGAAAYAWLTDDARWLVATAIRFTDSNRKSATGITRCWSLDSEGLPTLTHELPTGTWAALVDPIHNRILTQIAWTNAQILSLQNFSRIGPDRHVPGHFRRSTFSKDGRWVVTGESSSGVVRAWNLTHPGTPASEIRLPTPSIEHLAISDNGRRIAICSGPTDSGQGSFALASFPSLLRVGEFRMADAAYSTASFMPGDQKLAVARGKGSQAETWVLILDAETGELAGPALRHRGGVGYLKWSPDGRRLYSASMQGNITAWRLPEGQVVWEVQMEKGPPFFDLSPDGRWLLAAGDWASVTIVDADTGEMAVPGMRRANGLWSASFSKDGKLLVSASLDGEARLLRLRTSKQSTQELRLQAELHSGMEIGRDEKLRHLSPTQLIERLGLLSGIPRTTH